MKPEKVKYYKNQYIIAEATLSLYITKYKKLEEKVQGLQDYNDKLQNELHKLTNENNQLKEKLTKLEKNSLLSRPYYSKTNIPKSYVTISQIDIDGYTKTINDLSKMRDGLLKENEVHKKEYSKLYRETSILKEKYSYLLEQKEYYETALNTIDRTITNCNESICNSTSTNSLRTS